MDCYGAAAFAGLWEVLEAILPDGQFGYTGTIDIKQKRSVFEFDWDITAGRYAGIGLTANAHLYVGCGEQRAGLGIALYQVGSNNEVSIQWSTPELQGAIGNGTFNSRLDGSLEGRHEISQRLPDGSFYGAWTVDIRKSGSIYELSWLKGDVSHFSGSGLEFPNGLAVSWYPDIHQHAILDYTLHPEDSGRLLATWALGGFTTLGTERLKRVNS